MCYAWFAPAIGEEHTVSDYQNAVGGWVASRHNKRHDACVTDVPAAPPPYFTEQQQRGKQRDSASS